MKSWLWILGGLVVVGGVALVGTTRGQFQGTTKPPLPLAQPKPPQPLPTLPAADLGPGEQGAQLRVPDMNAPAPLPLPQAPPSNPSAPPAYVQKMYPTPTSPYSAVTPQPVNRIAQMPSRQNTNRDIEITEQAGAFAIFVMAYTGEKAPTMAREFVQELYTNPKYTQHKLRPYIFNYGAEEKKKEFERVQELRQKHAEMMQKEGVTNVVPIPIRAVRIDEQAAVLLGGYRDRDEAERALVKIKKLPQPDPKKVKQDFAYLGDLERDQKGNVLVNSAIQGYHSDSTGGPGYVNPFTRAFVTRNPSGKQDGSSGQIPPEDVALLRRINEGEPLSLFQCKHKFTLTIKQFHTQFKTLDAVEAKKFLATVWKTYRKPGDWSDAAAHNAHNLAEALRKSGLPETYVLHGKNCSFVTVGGYDDLQDQRLLAMQDFLAAHFRADGYRQLDMLPRPVPMLVPR